MTCPDCGVTKHETWCQVEAEREDVTFHDASDGIDVALADPETAAKVEAVRAEMAQEDRGRPVTAPAQDVRALLDRLEQAHAAATTGPWEQDWYEILGLRHRLVAETGWRPDAALIVAAVNHLPALVSALRAVADLADELDAEAVSDLDQRYQIAAWLRDALAAALSPTEVRP